MRISCIQELQTKSTWELSHFVNETDNMYAQAQILQILLNREGLYYHIENQTVEEKLESLARRAGSAQQW